MESMVYPQLTEAQRGYIAGFIDGDGHIGIVRRRRAWKRQPDREFYLRPIVQIGQKKPLPLEYIRHLVGTGSITCHGQRPYYNLRFYPGTLKWLLPELIPHLILKRPQAEIVRDFLERFKYHGKELTDQELQAREAMREKMEKLNAYGLKAKEY